MSSRHELQKHSEFSNIFLANACLNETFVAIVIYGQIETDNPYGHATFVVLVRHG